MGLPILDPILTVHSRLSPSKPLRFGRTDIKWDDRPILWVICPGLGMSVDGLRTFKLVPREGTSYIYTFPNDLVNPDPHRTLEIHAACTDAILADLAALPLEIRVSVMSISAGNAFGFYVANHFPVERFISVVSGAGLGKELFWSLICIPIARQTRRLGYVSGSLYDAPLKGRLPYDNVEHLPKKTHFYVGLADAQIPFWFGIKIYRDAKRYNPDAKLSLFLLGHVGVMYMLGRFFREGIEPVVYGEGSVWWKFRRSLAYTAIRVPVRDLPMLLGGLIFGFDRLNRLLQKWSLAET
jgi:hypothetical protein